MSIVYTFTAAAVLILLAYFLFRHESNRMQRAWKEHEEKVEERNTAFGKMAMSYQKEADRLTVVGRLRQTFCSTTPHKHYTRALEFSFISPKDKTLHGKSNSIHTLIGMTLLDLNRIIVKERREYLIAKYNIYRTDKTDDETIAQTPYLEIDYDVHAEIGPNGIDLLSGRRLTDSDLRGYTDFYTMEVTYNDYVISDCKIFADGMKPLFSMMKNIIIDSLNTNKDRYITFRFARSQRIGQRVVHNFMFEASAFFHSASDGLRELDGVLYMKDIGRTIEGE